MSRKRWDIIKKIGKFLRNRTLKRFMDVSGSLLTCATAGLAIREYLKPSAQIKENQVYSLEEASKLLKLHPSETAFLIDSGELPGKKIGTTYRILGKNLLNYLT